MSDATICGMMLYQDQSDRCALPVGHDGEHETQAMINWRPKLEVKPSHRKVEHYEDDPRYREVSIGNGLIYTVPKWIADILERHADEVVWP